MTVEAIKDILEKINFPKRNISEQTAICILALIDKTDRQGLLPEHRTLSDGARIHDILNYARNVIGKKVAENTREAYRKTSLAPMMSFDMIVRHQLSPRDPNTYYRLHPDFFRLFSEKNIKERNRIINQLLSQLTRLKKRTSKKSLKSKDVVVQINSERSFSPSPGEHNLLEKSVVEIFGHAFLHDPQVVYLGDAKPKRSYQNRTLMRKLNLPIDTSTHLPDVIIFSEPENHLIIVEVVTSSGSVNSMRLEQLQKFTKGPRKLGHKISYVSAFPSRAVFRRFVEDIAWGSSVWIENEANNIVHFEKMEG